MLLYRISRRQALLTRLAASALMVAATSEVAPGQTKTWNGPIDGLWEVGTNWTPAGVPAATDDTVVGFPAPVIVDGPAIAVTQDLTVEEDGVIEIQGGNFAGLTVNGASLVNENQILINNNDSAQGATLNIAAGATVGGEGEIVLYRGGRILHLGAGTDQFTNGATHTIRGEGLLYANFINEGVIVASDTTADGVAALDMTTTPGGGGVAGPFRTNNAVIRSSATAEVNLAVQLNQGANGRIIADGKTVHLRNSRINGGRLESLNGGIFDTIGNSLRLSQVHNLARIDMVSAGAGVPTIDLHGGGITNDGTIVAQTAAADAGASINFAENGSFAGSGEVILNRQDFAAVRSSPGVTGTNGANHEISGVGYVDASLINNGLVAAQPRNGGTVLELRRQGVSVMTNNSIMRADADAVLRLRGVVLSQDEDDGQILANAGTVELDANTFALPLVNGGRFETTAPGTIEVVSNTLLHNVTNNGVFNIQISNLLTLGGTRFTNNNVVTLKTNNSSGSQIAVADNVLLDGDGEIVLQPNTGLGANRIRVNTANTLTVGAMQTIRGEGFINGGGGLGTVVNNGRIAGDSSTDILEILGTLRGGGTLKNVQIDGTHAPGTATTTASVALEGAYTVNSFGGQVALKIGGNAPGTGYDRLVSTDAGNLITIEPTSTTLIVSLINGYVPANGEIFTLIQTAGTLAGQFDTINLPPLPVGYFWQNVSQPTKTLAFRSIAALAADFEEDGDVDALDLVIWKGGYGTAGTATHMQGDADADHDVDGADFLIWQLQLGDPASVAATAVVPEPATIVFAIGGGVILARRARR